MTSSDQASELPRAYLYLEDGDRIYRVHVDQARMLIGRASDNDIVIRADAIDPHHAVLYFAGGHFVLSAVTKSPPLVNGKMADGPRRLYNGDVINLSGHTLTFVKVPPVSDTVVQLGIWSAGEPPYFVLQNRPEIRIGHRVGDLVLADEFVGDPHCAIENFCAGVLFLVPIDVERGTKLNGVRVQQRCRLRDGDVLEVGATEVAVRVHARRALPGPMDLIPLGGLARARVHDDLASSSDSAPESEDQPAPARRRRLREILDEHHKDERGDRMVEVVEDFEEDTDDRRYYLPDQAEQARPSAMVSRPEDDASSGHTMILATDSEGKRKRDRYYLPDSDEAQRRRVRDADADKEGDKETRADLPLIDGEEDEGGDAA